MDLGFAVVYAKAVDDKQLGIYIEGVYFGGVGSDRAQADEIAKTCVNEMRGGSAMPKIIPITKPNSLCEIFNEAKRRFDKAERQMMENEMIMEENANKKK
jgi:hypothetical protein